MNEQTEEHRIEELFRMETLLREGLKMDIVSRTAKSRRSRSR